jgi:hypothetical protein
VAAAEDVERQIAVAIVIAVEEPSLLVPVDRIVGGVEIEDDLLGCGLVRCHEEVHKQPLDRRRIVADLVVAGRLRPAQFQPVQRRFPGQRRAVRTPRRQLAGKHRHHRVVAQLVVIAHILVAQRDPEHPLPDQPRHLVFDQPRPAGIGKARRKPLDQADRPIARAQQQPAGIRGHRPAIKIGRHPTPFHRCKKHRRRVTLCRHRGPPLQPDKPLSQKNYPSFRAPMHRPP